MKLKRTRPAPLVEDIDGRDEVLGEDERVVVSDGEAEWTVSDPLVPMEIEGVVAESTARRVLVNPRVLEHRRAGLLLKAIAALGGRGEQARCAPTPHGPGGQRGVVQPEAPRAGGDLRA